MKKITLVLIASLLFISTGVVYLVLKGISLRSAPIIQPSVIAVDNANIAPSLVQRLFQDFQNADYVVWGIPESTLSAQIIKQSAAEYRKIFNREVTVITDAEKSSAEQLQNCLKPCWLLVGEAKAHQLESDSFTENKLLPLNANFFTISLVTFNRQQSVPQECETQKRLNLKCLISISIREVQRKMRSADKKYFFLRKYKDNDYFLFIE